MKRSFSLKIVGVLLILISIAGAVIDLRAGSLSWARPYMTLALSALAGAATLVGAIFDGKSERLLAGRALYQRSADAIKYELFTVHKISPFDVGLAIWTPRRDLIRRLLRHPVRLKDVVFRQRARARPSKTGISWTVGKGAIGQCVKRSQVVWSDLSPLWLVTDELSWAGLPSSDTHGLTFEEFSRARDAGLSAPHGASVVIAVPIILAGVDRPLGCVAIDLPSISFGPTSPDGIKLLSLLTDFGDIYGQRRGA